MESVLLDKSSILFYYIGHVLASSLNYITPFPIRRRCNRFKYRPAKMRGVEEGGTDTDYPHASKDGRTEPVVVVVMVVAV